MDIVLERILTLLPKKPDGTLVHGARTAFAKSIGAPSNIFAEWIAGRNNSYKNYLYQIAAIHNVSVEWLKGETNEKSPAPEGAELSEARMKLLAAVDGMSEDEVFAVIQLAEAAKRMRGSHG